DVDRSNPTGVEKDHPLGSTDG
ncbi:hypothetical protein LCGC14_2093200, partial [marine sediment metagenome]